MPVKGLQLLPFVFATLFAGAALADERPRGMLGGSFDLKGAILSPTPIGPPSHFAPPPAAAKAEAVAPRNTPSSKPRQKTSAAARKPKPSPLDAYARDPRRQTWPCAGGGICAWTQPR